ncbi:MAG: hypothetical protein QNJ85_16065 [Gammaproteobacteria bacterium]|nr:hypothetical protein [Gammaproteobacteria bacterium]
MKPRLAALLLLALPFAVNADWRFEPPVALTPPPATGVFQHLDGAGRRHIAVAGDTVAVTWEDNRDGSPQVYARIRVTGTDDFTPTRQLSTGDEAYEPAIAALDDGRFLVAWEQDAAVYLRLLDADAMSPPLQLATGAGHATVAGGGNIAYTAWRERSDGRWFLRVARLAIEQGLSLRLESSVTVEADGLEAPLQFPALAAAGDALAIAWEDRRAGHTRLLTSFSANSGASFGQPVHLNEFFSNRNEYDKGSGVTRVALAGFAGDELLAAWMDKRRGGVGYGIYAALGAHGDGFGPNERVHGAEGDREPHYNPAVAGNEEGDFVVAWDDFRRGDSDLWLSRYDEDDSWGEDITPPIASGPGEQSHPSVALDERGDLHLLWIERADPNAPSRLFYGHGRRASD